MDYVHELVTTVQRAAPVLLGIPEPRRAHRPAPRAWSAKEIVGHLVDSAANNHQRFVRAHWQEDLVFPGYAQDRWVEAQRYQEAPWPELVALWRGYNLHLARVMAAVPAAVRLRSTTRHNFHEIAWQPVPAAAPATLEWFMNDYVGHLRHHLRQIEQVTGQAVI